MIFVQAWWGFQHFTGMDAPGSRPYNFWSGFGSDLAELTLIGGLVRTVGLMKRHHKEAMDDRRETRKKIGEINGR